MPELFRRIKPPGLFTCEAVRSDEGRGLVRHPLWASSIEDRSSLALVRSFVFAFGLRSSFVNVVSRVDQKPPTLVRMS